MEDKLNNLKKEKEKPIFSNSDISICQWFFDTFPQNQRKEIF